GRHGQCRGRVGAAEKHVDLVFVEPGAGARRGDVGLVLVVGDHEFDLLAVDLAARVFDGHAYGLAAAGAVDVGIDAGHVGDHADANDVIGYACGLARDGKA